MIDIRGYDPADREAVDDLRRSVYGEETAGDDVFAWRHFGHPSAPSLMQVATVDDEIVGIQPMEMFPFSYRGAGIDIALLTGVMVREDHRRQGIFGQLIDACEEVAWAAGASVVYTMPNDQSVPGFRKLGYHDCGERTLMTRPLAVAGIPPRGRRLPGVETVGRLAQAAFERVVPTPSVDARIERVEKIGDGYDDLDDRVATTSPACIQRRDQAWVTWRYGEAPSNPYTVVEARSGDRLRGFAVTTVDVRSGYRAGYLVDLLADDAGMARALSAAAVHDLADRGADVALSVVSDRAIRNVLARTGFVPIPKRISPKRFHTVCRLNPADAARLGDLADIDAWYLTFGDWDTI